MTFPHPLGLAAGMDKDGSLANVYKLLGFSFVESGTFTYQAQSGNPKPRMFRLVKELALVNSMGFNNPGAQLGKINLQNTKKEASLHKLNAIVHGINIGKSRSVALPEATDDYLNSIHHLTGLSDYWTINVSSPNTPQLHEMMTISRLSDLLKKIKEKLTHKSKIFVKLAPNLKSQHVEDIIELLIDLKIDGIILTNTQPFNSAKNGKKIIGGISGQPIRKQSTELIRFCFPRCRNKLIIVGVGGIMDGPSALEKIFAGASLLQIYTGLIYQGPYLAYKIAKYIEEFLRKENCVIRDIIGAKAQPSI